MIKPILFSSQMVRAILDGRKTMTRRVDKDANELTIPLNDYIDNQTRTYAVKGVNDDLVQQYVVERRMPICVGDILWVRETWTCDAGNYYYRADIDSDYLGACETLSGGYPDECKNFPGCDGCTRGEQRIIWHPSIHMPKAAARIFLRVTDVRAERLQDITEEDVCAEGAEKLITCQQQHGIIESDGTLGDMCWNSTQACAWCTELTPYEESFGKMVWNSTIKKKDLPLYGWEANPWVWVYTFERVDKPEGW